MDTETNPIESESELVEPSERINENGCDDIEKPKVIEETVTDKSDDKEIDQSIEPIESDQKHGDDSECSPLKSSTEEPIILSASENEPFDVIDSDASQNNSPEKNSSETTPVAEPEHVVETKHTEADDELPATEVAPCNTDQIPPVEMDDVDDPVDALQVDSSPEKSSSEMACLIPSPSDPMNDSVNANFDDSVEEEEEEDDVDDDSEAGGDNEFSKRSNPKTVEQKANNNDCQVFELTDDDNSSVDDARESDGEDDIDADEEEEDEEDEDEEPRSGKDLG